MQVRDRGQPDGRTSGNAATRTKSSAMASALSLVVPGQPLRQGLERILLAKRGALIVVGDGPDVLAVCTGGFLLDAEFSPQRISELAKLDGAVVLSSDASRIARANVHLLPEPSTPTTETGTRHRTAERTARSIDVPVISVSAAMSVVTVYCQDSKHVLRPASHVHERVSHAMQTLQRFRQRFDIAVTSLSSLEVEDVVTVRDVAAVLQPAEIVLRISTEIGQDLLELGDEGGVPRLQLDELTDGLDTARRLVVRDYIGSAGDHDAALDGVPRYEIALERLAELRTEELADPARLADVLRLPSSSGDFDAPLESRGYRLLGRLPRFGDDLVERIIERFGGLQGVMRASVNELTQVDGVGTQRARSLKDGLARQVEATILDRYN
ncbi:MAG: DNA integrity scanning diadenylate cyclase DisA [Acidimicrobiales bacterium]